MSLFIYISVFLGALLSGLLVLAVRIEKKQLKLLLSFSGAFLFAISVLHLIPDLYEGGNRSVGIYILGGFFFQILLEFFSEGIEHGHTHPHKHGASLFPGAILVSLCVHSFLEGMPLAGTGNGYNKALLTGIILHNIPIAIALMSLLIDSGVARLRAATLLLLFACMTPLGAFVSSFLSNTLGDTTIYFNHIMGIVVGIFLHISTTILFESSENHRFNFIKFLTILLGAGVAWLCI
ncbi:MAG TPA: ZIP family metal transporter [Bacteroidia bacterium]|jgi:zinc transporter ZupT|nr:ZIP family metal transporter [Bacteroidia bacterium]